MVDHTGKVVIVSNYGGGSLASFRVLPDGSLSDMVSHFHFNGHGTNPVRQQSSHIHSAITSPDNRFVLVNDLGLDRIHVYRLDAGSGSLTANVPPFYQAERRPGPRNMCLPSQWPLGILRQRDGLFRRRSGLGQRKGNSPQISECVDTAAGLHCGKHCVCGGDR